jgi:hypothetical protein
MQVKLDQATLESAIVQQAVDEILGDHDRIADQIHNEAMNLVGKALEKDLNRAVEKTLNTIMEKALDTEVSPVNVWGEREGEPTTIRAALHNRAKAFWQEKVDAKGEKTSYGGRPRYEHVLSIITANEFDSAVKQNIVNVAGAIKDAVRADFYKAVDAKLNDFFKITSAEDQKRKGK